MNSQQRAELLAAIAKLCQRYPDWRFGQLVANVAGWADQEIWDVEDEQLLEVARLHLEQLSPAIPVASSAEAGRDRHRGIGASTVLAGGPGGPEVARFVCGLTFRTWHRLHRMIAIRRM